MMEPFVFALDARPQFRKHMELRGRTADEIERIIVNYPVLAASLIDSATQARLELGLPIDVPFDVLAPEIRLSNEQVLKELIGDFYGLADIDDRKLFGGFTREHAAEILARFRKAQ